MAIRPFYMSADIDGRSSNLSGGPKSKSGGQDITIYQRDNGSVITAFRVVSFSRIDGKTLVLTTQVLDKDGRVVAQEVTNY